MDGVSSKEQAIQLCQVSDFVFLSIVPRFNIAASKGVQFNVEQSMWQVTKVFLFYLNVQFCFNFNINTRFQEIFALSSNELGPFFNYKHTWVRLDGIVLLLDKLAGLWLAMESIPLGD